MMRELTEKDFKRGVKNPHLVGLSDIKPPTGQPIKQSDLSPDELKSLLKYRQTSVLGREKIQAYMDGLLDK